jgi:hypothetical protein
MAVKMSVVMLCSLVGGYICFLMDCNATSGEKWVQMRIWVIHIGGVITNAVNG